jgi:DNA anti-recombination protein RmuC
MMQTSKLHHNELSCHTTYASCALNVYNKSALCRYETGQSNPKKETIEHCMRLVHWVHQEEASSVEDLANKIRCHLGRKDQAQLRVALSKLIDGLASTSGSLGEPANK